MMDVLLVEYSVEELDDKMVELKVVSLVVLMEKK